MTAASRPPIRFAAIGLNHNHIYGQTRANNIVAFVQRNAAHARRIAKVVKRVYPAFSLPRFSKGLEVALEPLELKQRMRLIADRIEDGLPEHPPQMFAILTGALAVLSDESKTGPVLTR